MTISKKNSTWVVSPSLSEVTLKTQNTYVDANIQIEPVTVESVKDMLGTAECTISGGVVNATNGTATASATAGTVSQSGMTDGVSTTATAFYVTATGGSATASATGGNASITAVKDAHTAGYLDAKKETVVIAGVSKNGQGASDTATGETQKIYLKTSQPTIAGGALSVTPGTLTVTVTNGAINTSAIADGVSQSSTDYAIVVNGSSASANITKGTASATKITEAYTAGYMPAKTTATVTAAQSKDIAAQSKSGSGTAQTVYLKAMEMTNAVSTTEASKYIETTAPVLTSGGYLYLKAGYTPNIKISLANLVPDEATFTNEWLHNSKTAYDNDGNLVIGTMSDLSSTNFTSSIVNLKYQTKSSTKGYLAQGAIVSEIPVYNGETV